MVYGLWFVVYGLWFVVYGLWFVVGGLNIFLRHPELGSGSKFQICHFSSRGNKVQSSNIKSSSNVKCFNVKYL